MLIDLLGLAMPRAGRLIRVRPSRWRARRLHTRLRPGTRQAMPHGWHAGQAVARMSCSAARTFRCKVPMFLT
jgi:hypothetical protein